MGNFKKKQLVFIRKYNCNPWCALIKKNFSLKYKLFVGYIAIIFGIIIVGSVSIDISKNALKTNIVENSVVLSNELMNDIDKSIYHRIEELQIISTGDELRQLALSSNLQFDQMNSSQEYIDNIEDEWDSYDQNMIPLFIQDLLTNEISIHFNEKIEYYIQKYKHSIFENLFATNKYGTIICFSNITDNYYQANEIWWQQEKNNGMFLLNK